MTEPRVEYWIITTPAGKVVEQKFYPAATLREVQAQFTGCKCEPAEEMA